MEAPKVVGNLNINRNQFHIFSGEMSYGEIEFSRRDSVILLLGLQLPLSLSGSLEMETSQI